MIIGIDPSYTGTGIAVIDNSNTLVFSKKIDSGIKIYSAITSCHKASESIMSQIIEAITPYLEYAENNKEPLDVIIEYPVLATRSGAYLAILNGYLASFFNNNPKVSSVTWIPPMACDSYTGNKKHQKTYLVNYCLSNQWISKRKTHDECTALILCHLLIDIRNKKYKNSWFQYER